MPVKDVSKEVKYINKDFVNFRNALMNFSKAYFPDSYNDFNEASLGMMFMEMSSYVGDVLSYYTDANLKEAFLNYAEERQNIIYLAQSLGYKYKTTVPASTNLDVYQIIPSIPDGDTYGIDYRFALKINENMIVQSETFPNVQFRTTEPIDFSVYDDGNYSATVYEVQPASGIPSLYMLKKSVPAVAGTIATTTFSISSAEQFLILTLPNTDIIEVLDVYDENSNRWYEVDYLAQDTILFDEENSDRYSTEYNGTGSLEPSRILKLKRVAKRFITRRNKDGFLELQFGAGNSAYPDEWLVPSPTNARYNNTISNFTDISNNYLNTRTYGATPLPGTTLTVRYTRGGGIESNVPQSDLNKINFIKFRNSIQEFADPADQSMLLEIQKSVAVLNPDAATGGRGAETIEEIRQNAMSYFSAQDRTITDKDFLMRVLTLPAKYGTATKAYVEKDINNFSINIYTLGYNSNRNLVLLNDTIKKNLVTYLNFYRDLTTGINIKDAYIINIGIRFTIITYAKYNKNDVILRCIAALQDFFDIDNWQIGQPIILRDLYERLDKIDGVRTVSEIDIYNKYDSMNGYSDNYYDISAATVDNIIYPSVDPSIFELKYPNVDIEGSAK